MARLRYLSNARTGEAGTVCNGDLTVTGNIEVTGSYTYGSGSLPLSQNLQGTFTVGQDDTGYDVIFYGDGTGKYWLWDESADSVILKGAMDIAGAVAINGDVTMYQSDQINFYNTNAYIQASSASTLKIYAATAIAFSGPMTADGKLIISPTEDGTFIDFALETEWVHGTLINADSAAGGVTFDGNVIGVFMDFNTYVTAADDCDITGYKVEFAGLTETSATETNFIGFDLPVADAIDIDGGTTFNWKGVNLKLPNESETNGTMNVYGVYISAGTYGAGNEYGAYITGTQTGLAIVGACTTGITMSGTYATAALSINTTLAAYNDYAISSVTTTAGTTATCEPNYFKATYTGAGAHGRTIYAELSTDVSLGQWSNAIKGLIDFNDAGSVAGLGSAICAEMVMGTATMPAAGTYGVLELELVCPAEWTGVQSLSFIHAQVSGDDDAIGVFEETGNLINIVGLNDSTGNLWFDNTLRINVAGNTWYIPLSSAQATYTSAYPVALTNAEALDIQSTVTTEWAYPFTVKAAFATNKAQHGYAAGRFRFTVAGDTDISGTAFISCLKSELRIIGDGSSTALSSNGLFAGIEGRYYTDNTDGIAVSNGVHCALAGQMLAGENYVLSSTADYCGLAIVDFTHASATIAVTKYSGVLIAGLGSNTMGNALKVGYGVTNFLEIVDDDAIASLDDNSDTATNPDGYIRISIGGQPCYIWTYTNIA